MQENILAANPPDVNPIEKSWAHMKRLMKKKNLSL
jgi:transposase